MEYLRKDKSKKTIKTANNIEIIPYELYNTGSCQCYKDCDCYKYKGVISRFNLYKHEHSKRLFDNLIECEKDMNLCLIVKNKRNERMEEAVLWFNSMSIKEQNKIINLYKESHGNMFKRHNHDMIRTNNNAIYQIYSRLLKCNFIEKNNSTD